jgi:hypothetical protein
MRWHISQIDSEDTDDVDVPWLTEEELFIERPQLQQGEMQRRAPSLVQGVGLIAVACSMSAVLMSLLRTAGQTVMARSADKVAV